MVNMTVTSTLAPIKDITDNFPNKFPHGKLFCVELHIRVLNYIYIYIYMYRERERFIEKKYFLLMILITNVKVEDPQPEGP